MSEFIRKQHNVSILLYHIVCPAKYRKAIFIKDVDEKLKEIGEDIALRYEIEFWRSERTRITCISSCNQCRLFCPKKIVQIIKSITAREIFKQMPSLKKQLWGGQFWSEGYFVSTVGAHASEEVIKQYVKNQGSSKENL